jgi:dTDP-4-dehydrorhamnose 3,5-epimerase-like enzyme
MTSATAIHFKKFEDPNGVLVVYEGGQQVPFDMRRVFTVSARVGDTRGDHAHKQCTQLLICVSGKIRVSCNDGAVVTQHLLENMDAGLLVPPGIWAREEYITDGAVLMVLCDRGYEAEDYLRDYNDFKTFVGL